MRPSHTRGPRTHAPLGPHAHMYTSMCACTRRWSQPFWGLGLPSGSLRHLQAPASCGLRAEPAPGRLRVWGWWDPYLDVPWQQEAHHLTGVTALPLSLGSSRKVGAHMGGSSEAGHLREAGARGGDCPRPRGKRLLGSTTRPGEGLSRRLHGDSDGLGARSEVSCTC